MKRVNKNPPSLNHGKVSTYTNHKCRCALCKEAWRVDHLRYMHSHPEQLKRHAEYQITKYYQKRLAGHPEALMVALVKYQYNPNYKYKKV